MSDHHAEPRRIAPLFSVIIPLEYHRGQWERCWQGWQSQTLDRDSFEIILVVPPDFPERGKLRELADPAPRLEYSQHSHDIALSADGAAAARGKFLFFTESHCWPEPDVLERCLQAFFANADWAGFSCKSLRVCPNRLSEAEADMYEADTDYGMIVHPWRKILDVCFAPRRRGHAGRDRVEGCGRQVQTGDVCGRALGFSRDLWRWRRSARKRGRHALCLPCCAASAGLRFAPMA